MARHDTFFYQFVHLG